LARGARRRREGREGRKRGRRAARLLALLMRRAAATTRAPTFVVLVLLLLAGMVSAAPDPPRARKGDYYGVLGVARSADAAAIRRAYRTLSLRFHPDKNPAPDAQERFIEVSEAYSVLSDDAKRKHYDRWGAAGGHGGGGGGATSSSSSAASYASDFNAADAFKVFDSFLDDLDDALLDEEKLNEIVNMFGGEKDPAKQGWIEWGVKATAKRAIKTFVPWAYKAAEDGAFSLQVNGVDMTDGLAQHARARNERREKALREGGGGGKRANGGEEL